MGSRFAENIHDARQRLVGTGTHVERLVRKDGCIDAGHVISSRSSSAHSRAAEAGQSMLTMQPRRRVIRNIASTGFAGTVSGTKPAGPK